MHPHVYTTASHKRRFKINILSTNCRQEDAQESLRKMGNVFVEIRSFFESSWTAVPIACIFDCAYVHVLRKLFFFKSRKISFFILADIVGIMRKYTRIQEFLKICRHSHLKSGQLSLKSIIFFDEFYLSRLFQVHGLGTGLFYFTLSTYNVHCSA